MTAQDNSEHTLITRISDLPGAEERSAYLIFLSGPMMGKVHALQKGPLLIGRSAGLGISLSDPGVSRRHCEIDFSGGRAMIRDLGSTNGTFVNNERVAERELRDGDKIQLSSATIVKYAYQDAAENVFHKELYKMAVVDTLTGAYNKRFFEDRIKEEFSYCLRNSVPLSLIMFDIDHFKKVNDTYGHAAGDRVLAGIGAIARSVVRYEDVLARYGGEEFVILLKNSPLAGALSVAERLRSAVEAHEFAFEGRSIRATVSLGVANLANRNIEDWQKMFALADALLYRSKNAGRNRISVP